MTVKVNIPRTRDMKSVASIPALSSLVLILLCLVTLSATMRFRETGPALIASMLGYTLATDGQERCAGGHNSSLAWYPPAKNPINDLRHTINGTGTDEFIFSDSKASGNVLNWCNMPHTNVQTYVKPSQDYKLEYVEVIQRHHKRTPYASNTFPEEGYSWYCSDEGLFYGGKPLNPYGSDSAATYWSVYTSASNPLAPTGFNGTCQFPQITRGGLDDSHAHGADLKAVYADMLGFLPKTYDPKAISFRVTNNVITSQVASMLIPAMFPSLSNIDTPLLIQPDSIDSLEPTYSCPAGSRTSYGPGSTSPSWLQHLTDSSPLFTRLDALSGVPSNATGWHMSWDHYFDNLSARLCHSKPLPCQISNPSNCVSRAEADEVFRLGLYEYSYIYRDAPESLPTSLASYGIWVAELMQHLKDVTAGKGEVKYRHNVAHDGSLSPLLSILQVQKMYWPGMGAEVVFELYSKAGCWFLRVLWGGKVLESSHPSFGKMEMVPLGVFMSYVDALVGVGASKVPGLCNAS